MTSRARRIRPAVGSAILALALAACSSAGGQEATSTTAVAPTAGGGEQTAAAPVTAAPVTTVAATTTTFAPVPVAPLTGLPTDTRLTRPAVVVKIDNHPNAPDQTGLNQADVVYEEMVEGITRFAAVFQSQDPPTSPDDPDLAPVGPIRSARTTDIDILAPLSRPLLVWSGGNAGVQRAVADASEKGELIEVVDGVQIDAGFFRDPSVPKPHNLYANMKAVYAYFAPADQGPPAPLFRYPAAGLASTGGQPVAGVRLTMDSTEIQWQWDADSQSWLRVQYGATHTDASGEVISATNVVVTFVDYQPSPADRRSPEAVTVGEGEAWVFTGGTMIRGTWSRPDRAQAATLRAADGTPITLTPGRTWVELPTTGGAVEIPAGADPDSVAYPPKP